MTRRPDAERQNVLAMLDQAIEFALGARVADPRWRATRTLPGLPALPRRPRVSVIIPTCDRPHLVRDAVASVLAQGYPHLEAVVINDGGASLAQHLPHDARLHLIEDGHKRGQSAARNHAVARSAGEVLFFLDDDDLFVDGHVERLVAWLVGQAAVFAYADTRAVIEELEPGMRRVLTRGAPFPGIGFSRARLHVHNHVHISGWAMRRPLFELLGGFDAAAVSAEDWDLALRVAEYCDFAYLAEVGAEVRIRARASDSVSKVNAVASYLPRIYGRFADRGDWLVAAARVRYAERTAA
jgi:glycosyltransferase involved in cell wall biosynthesis